MEKIDLGSDSAPDYLRRRIGLLRRRAPWRPISFGKWAEKPTTLPHIAFLDADWLAYQATEGGLKHHDRLVEVYRKARRIRIPQAGSERMVAEYVVNRLSGKFDGLELVAASNEELEEGDYELKRRPVLDLCFAHTCKSYDKAGTKMLSRAVRRIVMPGVKRLTAEICEVFFDDDENFDIDRELGRIR